MKSSYISGKFQEQAGMSSGIPNENLRSDVVPQRIELPEGVQGERAGERMPVTGAPLRWIMVAIVAWGIILALGVLWYDHVAGRIIWWKPLIIVICSLSFVSLWRLAVGQRAAREKFSS